MHWQLTRFSDRIRLGGDALIAVALAAAVGLTALAAGGAPFAGRIAAVPAAAGLLALVERRRRPLPVLLVVFAVVYVEEIASPHFQVATFLAVMVATYSLGAHAPRRVLGLGLLVGGVGVVIGHSLGKRTHYSGASADVFFVVILVLAPVLIGRVVRARSQLANSLREATERLKAARSERLAAGVAADRAQLSKRIDAALLDGLGRMVENVECETPAQVSALERIARELMGRLRGLLKDLRAGEETLRPGGSISELHARVQRTIEADAAMTNAPSAGKASPRRGALVSPRVIDAALAVVALVLTAGLLASTLGDHTLRGPRWGGALLAVAVAAPIAVTASPAAPVCSKNATRVRTCSARGMTRIAIRVATPSVPSAVISASSAFCRIRFHASSAACCSASFFLRPEPPPYIDPLSRTAASKTFSWSGPLSLTS